MAAIHIHGYSDKISVKPSERIKFMVSVEGISRYHADIVRLINGDCDPAGPGPKEEVITTTVSGEYPARAQAIYPGSHILVLNRDGLLNLGAAISIHAFIMPTTPAKGAQAIISRWDPEHRAGWALVIDEQQRLALWIGDGTGNLAQAATPAALAAGIWYSAGASYDRATGHLTVHLAPMVNSFNSAIGRLATLTPPVPLEIEGTSLDFHCNADAVIGGWADGTTQAGTLAVRGHYNGKIDRPLIYSRAMSATELAAFAAGHEPDGRGLIARLDFSDGIGDLGVPTDHVTDISGNDLHGRCVNMPARAVTGYNWQGREEHFIHAPAEYGAIHFHDDDLEDAGWEVDFELTVPETMRSAIYAAKVTAGDTADYIPFVVRCPTDTPAARIVFLMPTASYMAYSNEQLVFASTEAIVGRTPVLTPDDIYLYEHPELGLSTYDYHADGSGVCYVSRLRPIPNLRPHHRFDGFLWGLPADLCLIDWLEARGFDYDVITDEDLQREGAAVLRSYSVVLTGTHPEYYSAAMLDGMEDYLAAGGRLMYLGGNGFYWVTSYHPSKPHIIEVRKGEGGSRAWQARPGEYFHSTTGERGGLWRNRGRAPQKLVGVGFAAQGFDHSSYYRRMPDSHDLRVKFIFDGISDDELIGDFGLSGGGAAGYEIDRYDLTLGTPPDSLLLASSEEHSDNTQRVVEEVLFNYPGAGGTQDPGVRSDMVYFTTPGGGEVFSASSIAWCGSLSWNNYNNNVSRITENVLRRFADERSVVKT
jgi:N,N-dimethylformamidase